MNGFGNADLRLSLGVADMRDKTRENHLCWFEMCKVDLDKRMYDIRRIGFSYK